MLRYRLITGPLLIALLSGAVWLDTSCDWLHCACAPPGTLLAVLAALFALIGGAEMTRLIEAGVGGQPLSPIAGGLGAAGMTLAVWLVIGGADVPVGLLALVPMAAVLVGLLLTPKSRSCTSSVGHAAAAALATVWVGSGLGMLVGIYALAGWPMLALMVSPLAR